MPSDEDPIRISKELVVEGIAYRISTKRCDDGSLALYFTCFNCNMGETLGHLTLSHGAAFELGKEKLFIHHAQKHA